MKFRILNKSTLSTVVSGDLVKLSNLLENCDKLCVFLNNTEIHKPECITELKDSHKFKGELQPPNKITYFSFNHFTSSDKYLFEVSTY